MEDPDNSDKALCDDNNDNDNNKDKNNNPSKISTKRLAKDICLWIKTHNRSCSTETLWKELVDEASHPLSPCLQDVQKLEVTSKSSSSTQKDLKEQEIFHCFQAL